MSPKDVETAALKLPARRRARLAMRLITSLDRKRNEGWEEAWFDEAVRRDNAYREGRLSARPAKEVLLDARRNNTTTPHGL
jgi:hypothetical protein